MNILVGYDGSVGARDALRLAREQAEITKGRVTVITSLVGDTETSEEEYAEAKEILAEVEQSFQGSGIPLETHLIVLGKTPGEDIVEFAEKNAIDHIFIGVRKRSAVGKLITGSNARLVILNSSCPVTTTRGS